MNRFFVLLLLVAYPSITFTQAIFTEGKDWMVAKNNTEFTYRCHIEKDGERLFENVILQSGAELPLKLKSRPKNVESTRIIFEYDLSCYNMDMKKRYREFRIQALKNLILKAWLVGLDEYFFDGKISQILDFGNEILSFSEKKEAEEILKQVLKQYAESQLDPTSEIENREKRAAVIGAMTLAKGFLELNDVARAKAMKSLVNQLGTRKVSPFTQLMRKQNYNRLLVQGGIPIYNHYNFNGNEIQDYGNYKNTIQPFFSRIIFKSRPIQRQGKLSANFIVGFEYSESPFAFQSPIDSFSTSGIGHSFIHYGGSLGVDIRKEKRNSCIGLYIEGGGLTSKSEEYEYALVGGIHELENSGKLIEEDTRSYFAINPYVEFKGVSIFARWYAVLVSQEEVATSKLDYDQLIIGVSIPLIVQRRYH